MNDDDLKSMLESWKAPRAPVSLRARVEAERERRGRRQWWQWLWSGEIRLPVPVALAFVAALVAFGVYRGLAPRRPASLTDFEQVRQFEPRIVRNINYETNQ